MYIYLHINDKKFRNLGLEWLIVQPPTEKKEHVLISLLNIINFNTCLFNTEGPRKFWQEKYISSTTIDSLEVAALSSDIYPEHICIFLLSNRFANALDR